MSKHNLQFNTISSLDRFFPGKGVPLLFYLSIRVFYSKTPHFCSIYISPLFHNLNSTDIHVVLWNASFLIFNAYNLQPLYVERLPRSSIFLTVPLHTWCDVWAMMSLQMHPERFPETEIFRGGTFISMFRYIICSTVVIMGVSSNQNVALNTPLWRHQLPL